MDILLDTCACIWIVENASLAEQAISALDESSDEGRPVYISPITAWETGMLASRRRLALSVTPIVWFQRLVQVAGFQLWPLSPEILVASSFLPGEPPRDPADRIIVSTARQAGLRVMTRDRLILDYADAGHVAAIGC